MEDEDAAYTRKFDDCKLVEKGGEVCVMLGLTGFIAGLASIYFAIAGIILMALGLSTILTAVLLRRRLVDQHIRNQTSKNGG